VADFHFRAHTEAEVGIHTAQFVEIEPELGLGDEDDVVLAVDKAAIAPNIGETAEGKCAAGKVAIPSAGELPRIGLRLLGQVLIHGREGETGVEVGGVPCVGEAEKIGVVVAELVAQTAVELNVGGEGRFAERKFTRDFPISRFDSLVGVVHVDEKEGITPQFIFVEGTTRINVKVKGEVETEINAAGPNIGVEKFQQLMNYFKNVFKKGDIVFLAGNAAPGLDETSYVEIAKLCHARGVKLVLDTTKNSLLACLPYQPFMIKPNQHELEELFGVKIETKEKMLNYAFQLREKGARNVLISCGGEGAFLVSETGQVLISNAPKGTLVNSVGSGDSMLAGFMAKFIETSDYQESLKQGAAAGSATAFSIGVATKTIINTLLSNIEIRKIQH